jgi:RNA polymerase sigma-70 factor (ECF subfamily)
MREFKKAFRVLAGSQRQALLMTALEGQSHHTIAAHSGVSVGTVKSRLSRARATLRQFLGTDEGAVAQPFQRRSRPRRPGGHAEAIA